MLRDIRERAKNQCSVSVEGLVGREKELILDEFSSMLLRY